MIWSVLTSVLLFVALLAALECGRAIGRRYMAGNRDDYDNIDKADGVVFAILGLVIAFTFTSSAARFDRRRDLIVQQANAVNTVWQRLDVLADEDSRLIREHLLEWVRLASHVSDLVEQPDKGAATFDQMRRLQQETWSLALAASQRGGQPAQATLVLTPMNDWINLSNTRLAMIHLGLPPMVLPTLILLAIVGALLAGFRMARSRRRSPLHMLAFAGVVAFAIYVINDLGQPRSGLIRLESVDHILIDMNQGFESQLANPPPP